MEGTGRTAVVLSPIVVEPTEDVPGVVERIRQAPGDQVQLILAPGCRFAQSRFNFQLLRQYAMRLGKQVSIASQDATVLRMAEESGFAAEPLAAPEPVGPARRPSPVAPRPAGATAMPPHPAAGSAAPPWGAPPPSPPGAVAGVAAAISGRLRQWGLSKPAATGPRIRLTGVQRVPGALPTTLQPSRAALYAGAVLVLVAGLLAAIFYVPSAQVTLVAEASPFSADVQVNASPGSSLVPIRVVPITKTASMQASASGVQIIPGKLATGQFTYQDNCPYQQGIEIFNGQRLATSSGVEFAQLGDLTIYPGQSQTVSIEAVQPGVAGNVAAGAITVIEQNQFSCLTGSNQDPTSGGVDQQQQTVIQATDISTAHSLLEQNLRQQILNQLGQDQRSGETMVNPPFFQDKQFSTDHQVGDQVKTFTATLTVYAEGDFYSAAALQRAFRAQLAAKVPAGKQLTTDRIQPDFTVTASQGGHVTFQGKATAYVAPKLPLDSIRNQLAGKSVSQARSLLGRLPIRSVEIQQSVPFPVLPLVGSRIDLQYNEVAAGPPGPG
jgi:hypothetical protein